MNALDLDLEFAAKFDISLDTAMVMLSHGFAEPLEDGEWRVGGLDRMATIYPDEHKEFVNAVIEYEMIPD